jgi:hypothetical protein
MKLRIEVSENGNRVRVSREIGDVEIAWRLLEREEAAKEINVRSTSGTARKQLWRKGGLVRDFEHFNFLHLEIRGKR